MSEKLKNEDFDENFYLSKYPITKDYYKDSGLSLKERLFHHYVNYGKESGFYKNKKEYRDKILGIDFEVDQDFDEKFYIDKFPEAINYLYDEDFSLRERLFHHYINYGKNFDFFKNLLEAKKIANKFFLEGNLCLAGEIYKKIYDYGTKDVEVIINYADCLGYEDLKIDLYNKALRIEENPFAYLGCIRFYIIKKQFDKAKEQLCRLKKLNISDKNLFIDYIKSNIELFETLIENQYPYYQFVDELISFYKKSVIKNSEDLWICKKLLKISMDKSIIFDNEIEKIIKNKNQYDSEIQYFIEIFISNKLASLIVCCMNKEENLIKVLPSWANINQIREIIIVDYSSTNPLSQNKSLLEISDKIKIIRVDGENVFNLGKAYNLAVDFCNYNMLIKIDCDYFCKDPKWPDLITGHPERENIFIHGDWNFDKFLTGFFVIHKSKFLYFREDFNGYGYDETDLYERIRKKYPNINEINWFDIGKSIEHLDHDDEDRTKNYSLKNKYKSLEINYNLCKFSNKLIRNKYCFENKVTYKKQKIDKIFCINLIDNKDRWEKVKNIPHIERFDAVKIEKNIERYGLKVDPVDVSSYLYFKSNPND